MFVFLLTIPIIKSYTDGERLRDAIVLILISSEDNTDEEYRQVIEDTVKIEFDSTKFQVFVASDVENNEIGNEEDLFKLAEKIDADFVFTGIYSIRNKLLYIEFVWYDIQLKMVSDPATDRIVLDLTFDESVSETVTEIIVFMNERILEFPFVVSEEPEYSSTAVVVDREQNQIDSNIPSAEKRINYFEVAAGFSPFLSIGKANDYFKAGFFPTAYFEYVFNKDFGKFGLGIFAGFNGFSIEGSVPQIHSFIPIGVNFIYKTPSKKTLNFFTHIGTGPALFTVNFNDEKLSKIILFIFASVGLDIQLTEIFGVSFEFGFSIFFEEDDPIMGFTPGVYSHFRI